MDVTLQADARTTTGSAESRRLRAKGSVPGVVYGAGMDEAVPVAVDRRELVAALSTDAGLNALITLTVNGDSHLTLARQIQRHPVKNHVVHVDFLAIRRDQEIHAEIPVHLTGEAPATKNEYVVAQVVSSITVSSLPGAIPDALTIDISGLEDPSQSIRAGDIALPEGVALVGDPDEAIVTVTAPEAPIEEAVPEEEVEVPEGEEAAEEEAGAEAAAGGPAAETEAEAE